MMDTPPQIKGQDVLNTGPQFHCCRPGLSEKKKTDTKNVQRIDNKTRCAVAVWFCLPVGPLTSPGVSNSGRENSNHTLGPGPCRTFIEQTKTKCSLNIYMN